METGIKEVLFQMPHVVLVRLEGGEYCLVVEDTELNDYVEDLLWDNFEYRATSVSQPDRSLPAVYYNYFNEPGTDYPIEGVIEALQQLDAGEVERIFRLNN